MSTANTILPDPYVREYNRMADGGEICSGGFDPKNNPDDRNRLFAIIAGIILFVILTVLFGGCSRKVYIPVERTTTRIVELKDTVVEIKLKEMRDTVTVTSISKDTFSYLENGLYFTYASIKGGKLGHSLSTIPGARIKDSVKVERVIIRDSIPYPVEVIVERKLTWWQHIKMEYGGFAMGAAAAFLAFFFLFLKYNTVKRE